MPQPAARARTRFVPPDPEYAARVKSSFDRQGAMRLIGARIADLGPGYCAIELPFRRDLTQQHGYIHAGIVSAIADSAGGYAGFTLFPSDSSVLTVEYKINLLAPADGDRLVATGRVVKSGRTLTICELAVVAVKNGRTTECAHGLQTLMCMQGRPDRAV